MALCSVNSNDIVFRMFEHSNLKILKMNHLIKQKKNFVFKKQITNYLHILKKLIENHYHFGYKGNL